MVRRAKRKRMEQAGEEEEALNDWEKRSNKDEEKITNEK
jgi:Spy/CpxP family protein refolding chaperone